jgi:hypothetical protein
MRRAKYDDGEERQSFTYSSDFVPNAITDC